MNTLKKIFFLLIICCTNLPSASAWILILNGTSSAGKTTLARNLQKVIKSKIEILQLDAEVELVLKEILEKIGCRYDGKTNFWDWFELLPEAIRKKIDENEEAMDGAVNKRIAQKAQDLDDSGTNVIVDTVLDKEADYEYLAKSLSSNQTYFVLVYAPIGQLLKNVLARNKSGDPLEKRHVLQPFGQFFFDFFEPCEVKSPESLDVLTKKDFEIVCGQLSNLIDDKNQKSLGKAKSDIDRTFFNARLGCLPHWLRNWLPCCSGGKDLVGIALKRQRHDFFINTGVANPIECAEILFRWLASKVK